MLVAPLMEADKRGPLLLQAASGGDPHFCGHLESANLEFMHLSCKKTCFFANFDLVQFCVFVHHGVHPLQPLSGPCSIEEYSRKWQMAILASLMRFDTIFNHFILQFSYNFGADVIKSAAGAAPSKTKIHAGERLDDGSA